MTTNLTRTRPPFPYDSLPAVPAFTLASADLVDGERIEGTRIPVKAAGSVVRVRAVMG